MLSCYATLTANLREVVNACLYLEKAGCPWRFLPKKFGPWQTVRTWHDRFRADGVWSGIAALLVRAVRQKQGRPATAILDSQSVVSGPQAGGRGVDGNKKVRGIKRHVLTCSLGFVLAVLVTAANAHGTQPVGALLDRADERWRSRASRSRVFGGGAWFAGWRMAASMAKASITSETWRCQPCQERVSLWSRPRSVLAVSNASSMVQRRPSTRTRVSGRVPAGHHVLKKASAPSAGWRRISKPRVHPPVRVGLNSSAARSASSRYAQS